MSSNSESRSGSPSSAGDDTKASDVAERGCDLLCGELLKRLRSASWLELNSYIRLDCKGFQDDPFLFAFNSFDPLFDWSKTVFTVGTGATFREIIIAIFFIILLTNVNSV